jgi:hypothetical protein
MKRVRKYTYLPQEEIEVIETKSGETIKSKEILDGNYVKAKPAPKKVVKKAVKKVRKKMADGGMMAKGGKLVGNQKKLDVNKNGKLDAEDFKMLRGDKMADGGSIQTMAKGGKVGMYQLMPYVNMGEKFSSPSYKETINFEGTQDEAINKANNMVDNSDRITSVEVSIINPKATNVLKMTKKIEMVRGTKMAKGGKLFPLMSEKEIFNDKAYSDKEVLDLLDEDFTGKLSKEQIELIENSGFKYDDEKEGWMIANKSYGMAKGGKTPIVRTQFEEEEFEYAKGGTINMNKHIWEGWTVGSFIEALDIEFKYHPKFKSRDEVKKWAMENQPYYKKYIPDVVDYYWGKNEEKMTRGNGFEYYADGGMMADGGKIDASTYLHINKKNDSDVFPLIDDGYYVKMSKHKEVFLGGQIFKSGMTKTEAINFAKDLMSNWNIPDENLIIDEEWRVDQFADGGKVTDKEVADSNVHMLHSNIKSIKHHAEELEDAIKDNTEVEGWVLAKADRAATAMSDITHYIDGRKMGTGGMVAGHHYKDKAGNDLRYIGPDSKNDNMGVFKNGEKYLTKSFNDFEEEKEKKSFWFGNGGFMPSGFSRKVSLSEKAEEMVGKNTWHILDASEKGEVIGELISDGALAVTMDRGGIVDADDWAKSMTKDKIYALKKAGYSENIASEMSLLPYEQLPMWVRQDFKKGSIVIGAYHIHKNDNIPVDGKVLVLNGDEEVVYSAETLDQAQEWAINQMQEVEDEDDGNYIYVSDCCGAEAGSALDIGICPMCGEHCDWEKQSAYADGGVTEATKFKVVYKLKDSAEPKEKLFDNAEKAEFFLETIQEDDDIESANLVEVKPVKKAAEKKAPTNLFAAAKPAAPSASKKTKEDVFVAGIADRIARYDALKAIIKNAEAEKEVIGGSLKEVGKEKFLELYELRRRNPETFNLADEDEKIMFIVMDKYIKVEPEKEGMLENYPGLLETTTTYKFNPALLDRTGEIVSRLIMESTELSDDEKANLIVAETKVGIKTGSIDRLMDYDNPAQIFDLIEPILALK